MKIHFAILNERFLITLLRMTDFINVYGLILIGLALFIGIFSRAASLAGGLLLGLYYFAYPPYGNLSGLARSLPVVNFHLSH
ncbi:MAG: hypothetical protein M0Q53_04630 [Prolixibacteraceae bacterium]|jgi:uncharacterized membrane protein YphA (DoxX/SURF4 family)|nr:hypothetical protein [Prolixibacteraceae bacterium]